MHFSKLLSHKMSNQNFISVIFASIFLSTYLINVESFAMENIQIKLDSTLEKIGEDMLESDSMELRKQLQVELASDLSYSMSDWGLSRTNSKELERKIRNIKKNGTTYYFDFNDPDFRALRASIRRELKAKEKNHEDPIVFTIVIMPKLASERDEFLVMIKIIDDSIRKLISKKQSIKYLVKPILHSEVLINLEVIITAADENLRRDYKLLKKICKKSMIPELRKPFPKMNFRFESIFNAVDITRKDPRKNILRLVLMVFNRRNEKISQEVIKEIFVKIEKKYPQIHFDSSFNDLDPMNPDKDYLILSFDQSKTTDDTIIMNTTTVSITTDKIDSTLEDSSPSSSSISPTDFTGAETLPGIPTEILMISTPETTGEESTSDPIQTTHITSSTEDLNTTTSFDTFVNTDELVEKPSTTSQVISTENYTILISDGENTGSLSVSQGTVSVSTSTHTVAFEESDSTETVFVFNAGSSSETTTVLVDEAKSRTKIVDFGSSTEKFSTIEDILQTIVDTLKQIFK